MTRAVVVSWCCASCIVLGTVALTASGEQTERVRRIGSNDQGLRQLAITSPPPTYPATSLEKKITGVVVAATLVKPDGSSEAVAILQSPDAETGRAVHDAVMRWKFKSMGVYGIEGSLMFYFHRVGPRGVVLSPAEMREVINPGVKDVKEGDEPTAPPITDAEFRALSTRQKPVILDIRDRETFSEGHDQDAVNIPWRELLTRGPVELPASRHIVIDCRDSAQVCAIGAHILTSTGFTRVSILSR